MSSPDGRPVYFPRVPWHEKASDLTRKEASDLAEPGDYIKNTGNDRYKIERPTDWQEAKQAALKKVRKEKGPEAVNYGHIPAP